MIPDLLVAFLGVMSGAMAGLLPAVPAWLVPFLLLPILADISVYQIAIFWLSTMITSQFFSSISSISFGIPGENSSLIYINQTNQLCVSDRIKLLRQTADASAIATLVALLFAGVALPASITQHYFLNSTLFTGLVVYWAALMIILFSGNKNTKISLLLFLVGVSFASHDNIALPEWLLVLNSLSYDVTVLNLLVGLILAPRIFVPAPQSMAVSDNHGQGHNRSPITRNTLIGTTIGLIAGFLPGPTATIASSLAFKSGGANLYDRVIRAEAANNSVIIVGAMIFMILGVPLALDTVTINELVTRTGFNSGLHTIIDASFVWILIASTFLAWLMARNSVKLYAMLATMIDSRVIALFAALFFMIIDIFLSSGSINTWLYVAWCMVFSLIGVVLVKKDISAIPAILGFILGPTLIWTTFQLWT